MLILHTGEAEASGLIEEWRGSRQSWARACGRAVGTISRMGMIVVVGQFDIHPEDCDAAAELMRVMTTETVKERGCRHYAYSRDLVTPNKFQLSELWEDDDSLAAHFQAQHTATYRAGIGKLRVLKRSVTRYEVVNAKTL